MRESENLPHNATISELVVSAAIRYTKEDGTQIVIPSVRHFDRLTHVLLDELKHGVGQYTYEQGFVTNRYRFVDREEAMSIAVENGQLLRKKYSAELFSENLY